MTEFDQFWNPLPCQQYLAECVEYDSDSGLLTWKDRPFSHFEGRPTGKQLYGQSRKMIGRPAFNTIKGAGYRMGSLDGVQRYSHRVIWKLVTGGDPDVIDHINGVKTDNRWVNLRDVAQVINCRNKPIGKLNTTGQTGVFAHSQSGGWLAQINDLNGRTLSFYSKDRDEASAWRSEKEIEFGYISRRAA